eukprot:m.16176 g.16176  ORF g.16176 m.16176 type:complete len:350 (-) comp3363_c0_seq1:189-1238(-)
MFEQLTHRASRRMQMAGLTVVCMTVVYRLARPASINTSTKRALDSDAAELVWSRWHAARECTHFQALGCTLDVMEKLCTVDEHALNAEGGPEEGAAAHADHHAPEHALRRRRAAGIHPANGAEHDPYDAAALDPAHDKEEPHDPMADPDAADPGAESLHEDRSPHHTEAVQTIKDLLDRKSPENIYMCCCPQPYAPCHEVEQDEGCTSALDSIVGGRDLDWEGHMSDVRNDVLESIQGARHMMWASDPKCESGFFNPLPAAKCNANASVPRSLDRGDLFCEMLTWQWTELGDGNPDEFVRNGCAIPTVERDEAAGELRKGGAGMEGVQHPEHHDPNHEDGIPANHDQGL